uniref:LysM domain receptor-like kinase 3 n=1 Tax=Tanacetum cinerariifolium TaxID=118510 RepID=A0A6L2M5P1_TANCI|nr:LysM domain receptor-like kinase 3 [Tanacetum cinerariifolium]
MFNLALILFIFIFITLCSAKTTPLNCTESTRLCTSFIAFQNTKTQPIHVITSMFDVTLSDITTDTNLNNNYLFIKKNCSCTYNFNYLTNTTYTVRTNNTHKGSNGSVYDLVSEEYGGLAYVEKARGMARVAREGAVIGVEMFCGCSSGLWNYLMSYVVKEGDSVEMLASRFGVSMDSIERVNGIHDPDNVTVGALWYIPMNSVPGEPYPVESISPPAPAPVVSFRANVTVEESDHKSGVKHWWIIGGLGGGLAVILAVVAVFVCARSSICYGDGRLNGLKDNEDGHKFHILRTSSFWRRSGRLCCKSDDWRRTNTIEESSDRHTNIPKVIATDVFDVEKPVVFAYEEVLSCTDFFSETNLLGHGTYGSVYYGLLREQEVAVKRMTAMKTKEFIAEMKVLCKVHHTNLVELIGYAASDDELFLIYEYAQKGSLGSHIHDPQSKGHPTLSWIMRVQIALDTARGLEYIHEHTKPHYVHRDIKSSNILLDGAFKAKISDFGLAKLVGIANDVEASATRVVGTFGYLAPEYLRDGLATTKSDVYAFGVLLFELISGKEALTRTEAVVMKSSEKRSLASIMLAALKHSPDSMSMSGLKDHIDPNLLDLFPHDCVFKMATLAKQCVEEDPILRPDMKQIVITLSHILLSSVEWEATLAGNSQVFSGLVQGVYIFELRITCRINDSMHHLHLHRQPRFHDTRSGRLRKRTHCVLLLKSIALAIGLLFSSIPNSLLPWLIDQTSTIDDLMHPHQHSTKKISEKIKVEAVSGSQDCPVKEVSDPQDCPADVINETHGCPVNEVSDSQYCPVDEVSEFDVYLIEELNNSQDHHSSNTNTGQRRVTRSYMVDQARNLNSENVHGCLEKLRLSFSEDKKSSLTHIDPLWGHRSVLIFCHFGESFGSKLKTPCILLLDSLEKADHSKQLETAIRKFVLDIYGISERKEDKGVVSKMPFLVPEVPQQR